MIEKLKNHVLGVAEVITKLNEVIDKVNAGTPDVSQHRKAVLAALAFLESIYPQVLDARTEEVSRRLLVKEPEWTVVLSFRLPLSRLGGYPGEKREMKRFVISSGLELVSMTDVAEINS
jgi:hypothetical protein